MYKRFLAVLLLVLAAACESATEAGKVKSSPSPREFVLTKRDTNFRMSSAEQQELPAALDRDAVQELLSWIRPEHRAPTVALLQAAGKQGNSFPVITVDASHPELARIAGRLWKRLDHPASGDSAAPRRTEAHRTLTRP